MGAGKTLSIVAGIIGLVGIFVLNIASISGVYIYGIAGAMNLLDLFQDAETIAIIYGLETYMVYIIAVGVILLLISPLIQLIGANKKATAIIGSLLPLFVGVIYLLWGLGVGGAIVQDIGQHITIGLMSIDPSVVLVEGIIPFTFEIPVLEVGLGAVVILLSGLLGLISGFMSRDLW